MGLICATCNHPLGNTSCRSWPHEGAEVKTFQSSRRPEPGDYCPVIFERGAYYVGPAKHTLTRRECAHRAGWSVSPHIMVVALHTLECPTVPTRVFPNK